MSTVPLYQPPDRPVEGDGSRDPHAAPWTWRQAPVPRPAPTTVPLAAPAAAGSGAASAPRLLYAPLINRDFALLFGGQLISNVGDMAFDTALVLWIAGSLARGRTWAPLAVSCVVLAAAVPQIVVGPVAGVFVDRWDKRRTMLAMNAAPAALVAVLALVTLVADLPLPGGQHLPASWQLAAAYVDVVLVASCAQFFIPAQYALVKDIVPEARQAQALETSQATQAFAVILGPPLGALFVATIGVQWALALNVLSFLVAFAAIDAVRAPRGARSDPAGRRGDFVAEFRAGLRYVVSHAVLRPVLVAVVLTWLGFGALQTLGYFFITENLHAPPSYYGYFGGVFGLGAIAGGVLATVGGERVGLARILWIALVTSGLFVIVLSHLTSFFPALIAAFLFGISASAIIVTATPLGLQATEREYVGRVAAVINPLGRLAALVSVIAAGWLASTALRDLDATVLGIHFGPVSAAFTGMGLLATAGGVYAMIGLRGAAGKVPGAGPGEAEAPVS